MPTLNARQHELCTQLRALLVAQEQALQENRDEAKIRELQTKINLIVSLLERP